MTAPVIPLAPYRRARIFDRWAELPPEELAAAWACPSCRAPMWIPCLTARPCASRLWLATRARSEWWGIRSPHGTPNGRRRFSPAVCAQLRSTALYQRMKGSRLLEVDDPSEWIAHRRNLHLYTDPPA